MPDSVGFADSNDIFTAIAQQNQQNWMSVIWIPMFHSVTRNHQAIKKQAQVETNAVITHLHLKMANGFGDQVIGFGGENCQRVVVKASTSCHLSGRSNTLIINGWVMFVVLMHIFPKLSSNLRIQLIVWLASMHSKDL